MTSFEKKIKTTEYFVEATDFERHILWEKYHERLNWVQDNGGCYYRVGSVKSRGIKLPVMLSIFWATLNDKKVAFYSSNSQCVDWVKIEKAMGKLFGKKKFNNNKVDANNFHNCIHYCEKP